MAIATVHQGSEQSLEYRSTVTLQWPLLFPRRCQQCLSISPLTLLLHSEMRCHLSFKDLHQEPGVTVKSQRATKWQRTAENQTLAVYCLGSCKWNLDADDFKHVDIWGDMRSGITTGSAQGTIGVAGDWTRLAESRANKPACYTIWLLPKIFLYKKKKRENQYEVGGEEEGKKVPA